MQEDVLVHGVIPRLLMDKQVKLLSQNADIPVLNPLITRVRVDRVNGDILLSRSHPPICFSDRHIPVTVHGDEGRGVSVSPVQMLRNLLSQQISLPGWREVHSGIGVLCEYALAVEVLGTRICVFDSVEDVWGHGVIGNVAVTMERRERRDVGLAW